MEVFLKLLISSVVFGLIGIVLMILGYKVFDWITPKIDVERELVERNNLAVAIVVAAIILGSSIVTAAVVGG
jgi:putative membrane protein